MDDAQREQYGPLLITLVATIGFLLLITYAVVAADEGGEPAGGGEEVGGPMEIVHEFDSDAEGWVPGVADLPVDWTDDQYRIVADWQELPDPLAGGALFSGGDNHSDDLWMFWKRGVGDLVPGQSYEVEVAVVIASNVPEGMVGIGGAPGESVYVKAGASMEQPVAVEVDGWLRMNVDKGNQSTGGVESAVVGTMANPNLDPETADGTVYALSPMETARGFVVEADAEGVVWVMIGTDSGFEGRTDVFYDRVTITLTPAG